MTEDTMTVLVTDQGFGPEDWLRGYAPLAAMSNAPEGSGVDLANPALSARDKARLFHLMPECGLIRIRLRDFGDLAAFDLARDLRDGGFQGRLRAHGAVLARAYTLLRRAGFDEVELDPHQARRQPEEHWRNEAGWHPLRRA
ncbi:DUF934 domain-containing protein [Pararhodobacter sp. CCB-MM2]|uniref:DUF934 domain-containing protein n=1 Tax=Pararhodobacter sp. CCB-MM2 TaxID=1786003 RepID=UPI0009F43126|nr:DUF934 domain-containing protein [Pararhodobacter sp. CCB-MM2]